MNAPSHLELRADDPAGAAALYLVIPRLARIPAARLRRGAFSTSGCR